MSRRLIGAMASRRPRRVSVLERCPALFVRAIDLQRAWLCPGLCRSSEAREARPVSGPVVTASTELHQLDVQSTAGGSLLVQVPAGGFVDIWWKYTP